MSNSNKYLLPLHTLFTWRYFKAKRSVQAITIIARITGISIAVGTAALLIVLSIFNGFEGLVKDLYASFYPDIRITHKKISFFEIDSLQVSRIRTINGIKQISLTTESNAIFLYENNRVNLVLKGVDENYGEVSGLPDKMIKGNFITGNAEQPYVVIGSAIEHALQLQTDRSLVPVTAYLPKKNAAITGNPMEAISTFNIYPSGAFSIQQEFDNRYAITDISIIQQMLGVSQQSYSGLEIKLQPHADQDQIIQSLQSLLGAQYEIEDRYQQNRTLYTIMQSEKWVIFGILSFILILASFNMIGTLTLMILEKEKDIQILKSLGAKESFILNIFMGESLLLGLSGGLAGFLIAWIFCFLQETFHLIPLQGSFVINYYPVDMKVSDVLLVMATITCIAFSAGIYPAWKASKKNLSLKGH
ncbi:MAG: FtsX-like permease family protein [Bacteroidota bacterium]